MLHFPDENVVQFALDEAHQLDIKQPNLTLMLSTTGKYFYILPINQCIWETKGWGSLELQQQETNGKCE